MSLLDARTMVAYRIRIESRRISAGFDLRIELFLACLRSNCHISKLFFHGMTQESHKIMK
jgi:hypothetical protein